MAAEKTAVLLIGPPKPVIVEGLASPVQPAQAARAERARELFRRVALAGARHRGRRHEERVDGPFMSAFSPARDRFELRRRLRPCRCRLGRRARHHGHQHAGRAHRGGRRYRARPAAVHGARVAAGRALSARRQVDAERLSAEQGDAARPHRRAGRHGPHRAGDRAPARRDAGARRLSFAAAGRWCALPPLSEAHRHGARCRRASRHHAGRNRRPETSSMRRCWQRSDRTAFSSTWRAARWSTRRR